MFDYLNNKLAISIVTGAMINSAFCTQFEDVNKCKQGLYYVLPLALPALAEADRSWIPGFCRDQSCM